MTQMSRNPAFSLIEDRLDEIGQKYRVHQILRGALLWFGYALMATVAACFAAHFLRQGAAAMTVAIVWSLWLILSAIVWIGRPLFLRPRAVQVARLVENRVAGLHNGLTNSVLLASADDLSQSEYLPTIFEEVLENAKQQPLGNAVRLADLNSLAMKLGLCALPFVVVAIFGHSALAHGWRQMFSPAMFVPQTGAMEIVDIQPGDVTLVAGEPLEISVNAKGPQSPQAKLIFDDATPTAMLLPTSDDAGLHYSYRMDHVDHALKYRVEVGGTQSQWFTVKTVMQVKLTSLDFSITPPIYTGVKPSTMTIKPEDLDKTPITVPQGSKVEIGASIDVPSDSAMLQVTDLAHPNDIQQMSMTATTQHHRFIATLNVMSDTTLSVGIMQGAQMIAKLPADGLVIHCRADDGPKVEMIWPNQDGQTISPKQDLSIQATLSDDYGLSAGRLLLGIGDAAPTVVAEMPATAFDGSPKSVQFNLPIHLTAGQAKSGQSIHVQVETVDNRELTAQFKATGLSDKDPGGPQTSHGASMEIKFEDPTKLADEQKDTTDKLRAILMQMLKSQQDLQTAALAFHPGDRQTPAKVNAGQIDLRNKMTETADKFPFDTQTMMIKRTLQMLVVNSAKQAIDLSAAIGVEPVAKQQLALNDQLREQQQHVISTLEALLAMLNLSNAPTTQPADKSHDPLLSKADAFKKLNEALKQYMKEQQRILDQTASLAKKPVDNFDDADKKKLDELKMAQEKLDAFMQQKISDFSKNAEQDMSNPDLLKDLFQIEDEVTMAKDALKQKSAEIAVPAEEMGLELAKEQSSNIEKWLANAPDRQQWTQEDPTAKTDTPMPELPAQLEDMMGKLMEQQEDLFQDMEDANANWTDSMDKGVGWDAADGPIADMSAKGVTGNVLPNNNEMGGRSGEGRSGKSQGEFVGKDAVGKGGRKTPTRLDPTPFQKGQINDTSKDPTGGATGGGKVSGEGGEGLEGPVPPKQKEEMQRLAQQQAQLRNKAERLNLQYQLGRYDNFKLLQSIAMMRRVESDLNANRYQNALRRRDVLLDDLETSHMLLGGKIHVEQDTTPQATGKAQQDINDAMKGTLPPAWSDALKAYYAKLGQE